MEACMTKLQEKAQGRTKQAVGQIVGDDKLVQEGKQQVRKAEKSEGKAPERGEKDSATNTPDEKSKTFWNEVRSDECEREMRVNSSRTPRVSLRVGMQRAVPPSQTIGDFDAAPD
jgi:uncharacterized protein YjbJ (UPF0337 family)